MSRTGTVNPLAGRALYREMSRATMHPVLGHALEQVVDDGAVTAFQRVLHEPFMRERARNPALTLRQFLLDNPDAARMARRLLGDDQYILTTRIGGPEYFDARGQVLAALRDSDAPPRQWLSWGHWGSGTPDVELYDGMPRILPVDYPTLRTVRGQLVAGYPTWSTGRKRLFMNIAYLELSRRLGTDIPTDVLGNELLTRVTIPRDVTPQPFVGEARLWMSTTQVAQMLTSGRSPALSTVVVRDGVPLPPGARLSSGLRGRAADDARWELFRRTGDPEFVDVSTFDDALARHRNLARDNRVPTESDTDPGHAVTTLSAADLVAVARNRPRAPRIASVAVEVEHRRAQRAVRYLERMLYAVEQAVDTRLIRHMCGLCDPHNLRIVTPGEHAQVDFLARYLGFGQRWLDNGARVRRVRGGRPVPDDAIENVPEDPLYETLEDLVPPRFDPAFDAHEDYARAVNVFFGFSPYQLEPVARSFQTVDVAGVLARFEAAHAVRVNETWNHFAGCVNAAIRHYEIDSALYLPLIVNGRPL